MAHLYNDHVSLNQAVGEFDDVEDTDTDDSGDALLDEEESDSDEDEDA